ncbi:MAG: MlaA family lipoprotein [Hyphomonadaceae bacterium]
MRLDAAAAVLSLAGGLALAGAAAAAPPATLTLAVSRSGAAPASPTQAAAPEAAGETAAPVPETPEPAAVAPQAGAETTQAEPPAEAPPPAHGGDPWESFNRKVFAFNEAIDRAVAEPIAKAYRSVTPGPVRSGVRNWVSNLGAPVVLANDLLQGQPKRAGVTALRFGVNTTVGILGVFDAAAPMGLERHVEDFGQTTGVWGAAPGPYLMLPLLGPSNVRDAFSRIVDIALDPITYASFPGSPAVKGARVSLDLVTQRTDSIEAAEDLRRTSDPYVTMRTAYAQARRSAIRNGQESVEDLPDFVDTLPDGGESTENPVP